VQKKPMRKVFFILMLTATFLCGQVKPGSTDALLLKVTFVGSQKYSQQALVDLSGLKIGTTFNTASLNEAANRLTSTGMFDDLRYRYNGGTVEFQVTENQDVVPCVFDNFVWYGNAELESRIRKLIPVFMGTVPNRGDLSDKVIAALEQIVGEKGVSAKVFAMPDAQLGGKVNSMVFALSSPEMKVGANPVCGCFQR